MWLITCAVPKNASHLYSKYSQSSSAWCWLISLCVTPLKNVISVCEFYKAVGFIMMFLFKHRLYIDHIHSLFLSTSLCPIFFLFINLLPSIFMGFFCVYTYNFVTYFTESAVFLGLTYFTALIPTIFMQTI